MEIPDYAQQLRNFCEGYDGPRAQAVSHAADVFDFFALLFVRGRLSRENQATVNAVIAYFIVPEDLYPEEQLGPFGLIDDLYVATHSYRFLRNDIPMGDMQACWKGEGDLEDVMAEIYRECRAEMGKKGKEALRMAGLG